MQNFVAWCIAQWRAICKTAKTVCSAQNEKSKWRMKNGTCSCSSISCLIFACVSFTVLCWWMKSTNKETQGWHIRFEHGSSSLIFNGTQKPNQSLSHRKKNGKIAVSFTSSWCSDWMAFRISSIFIQSTPWRPMLVIHRRHIWCTLTIMPVNSVKFYLFNVFYYSITNKQKEINFSWCVRSSRISLHDCSLWRDNAKWNVF